MAAAVTGHESRGARPLLVGLLRADCVAVLFASYSSGKWERLSFSAPTTSVEDFEGPWYFTSSSGQRSTLSGGPIVRFTGGDTFYEEWGVQTDHQPCHSGMHYPAERIGAVLNDALLVRPFQQSLGDPVTPESVASTLRADFERLEREALLKKKDEAGAGGWIPDHPRDPAIRRQSVLQVTSLHKSTDGDTPFIYFVIRRAYAPARADPPFHPVSVLHGWGLHNNGETIVQGLESRSFRSSAGVLSSCWHCAAAAGLRAHSHVRNCPVPRRRFVPSPSGHERSLFQLDYQGGIDLMPHARSICARLPQQ